MNLFIKYAWQIDIVFHVLTHMNVHNASNIFNKAYIEEIRKVKEKQAIADTLLEQVEGITSYYTKNFERLAVINFIPFVSNNLIGMNEALLNMPSFTEDDKNNFIRKFIDILEEEKVFYKGYWNQKYKELINRRAIVEEGLNAKLEPFKCVFNYYKHQYNKEIQVFLSYSMGQNGRGCDRKDVYMVAVPFPAEKVDEDNTFFMTLHELTHPCTDDLIGNKILMEDGSHALTENVVMLADYYLIKETEPTLVKNYLRWICNKAGNPNVHLDEKMLHDVFVVPQEVENRLKIRIKEIVNT